MAEMMRIQQMALQKIEPNLGRGYLLMRLAAACKNGAKSEPESRTRAKTCRSIAKTAGKTPRKPAAIGNESDLATRKIDLNLLHIGRNGSNLAPSWCGPGRF